MFSGLALRHFPTLLRTRSGLARVRVVSVAEDLDGVADGEVGAEPGKVRAELGEAADVAGGQHLGARCQDSLGFLLTQGRSDLGLVEVVGAGTAAAKVCVRKLA